MDIYYWGKLILSFYRYIEISIKAIDNHVLDKCINTSYYSYGTKIDIEKRFNDVYEFIDKKRRFINLKIIIEKTLLKLPERYQKIIMLNFFDNVSMQDLAVIFNAGLRSVYRYKTLGLTTFANILHKSGYTVEYFKDNYKEELSLFNSCVIKETEKIKVYKNTQNKNINNCNHNKDINLKETQNTKLNPEDEFHIKNNLYDEKNDKQNNQIKILNNDDDIEFTNKIRCRKNVDEAIIVSKVLKINKKQKVSNL